MTTNKHEAHDRNVRYARHIRDLCRAFHVVVFTRPGMKPEDAKAGNCTDGRACIMIASIRKMDETTYAVALHELGHCLSVLGRVHHTHGSKLMRQKNHVSTKRDARLMYEAERAAWEWAHHYAFEWTAPMSFVEDFAMKSYRDELNRLIGGGLT